MTRQALQAAFGRASAPTIARGSTTTVTTAARSFATSVTRLEGDKPDSSSSSSSSSAAPKNGRERSEAAAARLAQMSERYKESRTAGGQDTPFGSGLRSGSAPLIRKFPARDGGVIDARALRTAPGGSPFTRLPLETAPKILSFRSLPRKTADEAGKPGLARRAVVGFAAASGGSGARIGGSGGPGGRQRTLGVGLGAGGGSAGRTGGPGGARRTGGVGGFRRAGAGNKNAGNDKDKKKREDTGKVEMGKLTFNEGERKVLDRLEKGEVIPFQPKLTAENLSGYGPGIASDTALGQAENVMRTMRLMSGGQAYNSDSSVTVDADALYKRYFLEHKPIFFNSEAEKQWLQRATPEPFNPRKPRGRGRRAILNLAVLGKYKGTEPAAISNVVGMISNYHNRTHTYNATDSKKFLDKVLSLLPQAQAAPATGVAPKRV